MNLKRWPRFLFGLTVIVLLLALIYLVRHINSWKNQSKVAKAKEVVFNKLKDEISPLNVKAKATDDNGVLSNVFSNSDKNLDGVLTVDEITSRINSKVKEHMLQALKENFFIFTAIDKNPRNGIVSWDEYHYYFLKQRGYNDDFITSHKESHTGFSRELKETIMRDKAAWSEAARNDPHELTIDEFLAFRHPESSHANIVNVVEETFSRLDIDDDGVISESEFCDPLMNEVPEYLQPDEFYKERQIEFKKVIDKDNNGKADRKELIYYFDPRNVHHSAKEAAALLTAADANHDGALSLEEIIAKKELFLYSKMVDATKSFHDEF